MKRPCSTTPATPLIRSANSLGSVSGWVNVRSRMRLPLSVRNGRPATLRSAYVAPSASSRRPVWRHRNGNTSVGKTPRPRCSTSFVSSATTMKRAATVATSFSRVRAPPRPLTRLRDGSISSAPSTARSILSTSSVVTMPSDAASSAVASDVATAVIWSPSRTMRPRPSVKYRAVDPVPSASTMPGRTRSRARADAACFSDSRSVRVKPAGSRRLHPQTTRARRRPVGPG